MKKWSSRSREVANLLNPAFCGRLLYATIKEYECKAQAAFPFPLIYLVLPLVLHKETRQKISSKTQFIQWVSKNQNLLINFSQRAKELVEITNEALELLLQCGLVYVTVEGKLQISADKKMLSKTRFIDDEVKDCIQKSEHVARWFANTGKVETIYICLGVRP